MTLTQKTTTGNSLLDTHYDNKYPAGSTVSIRTGAPAGPDNAAGGTELVPIVLPATPWAAAAAKSKSKQGTWSAAATNTGTAAHFRTKNAADTEREEGTATATGGGGDMTLDNTSIAAAQVVTITAYTRTVP